MVDFGITLKCVFLSVIRFPGLYLRLNLITINFLLMPWNLNFCNSKINTADDDHVPGLRGG